MKVISVYSRFSERGGAEDMATILAEQLNDDIPVILTRTKLELIHESYKKRNIQFSNFTLKNIMKYKKENCIIISHSRKETSTLVLLNLFLLNKLKIIHVSHCIFTNLKCFTFFPTNIVAISNAVKNNLIEYFKVEKGKIEVIYNGIEDYYIKSDDENTGLPVKNDKIKILFAARICKLKQQVEFVKNTDGYLNNNIEIYFAGLGEDMYLLKNVINNTGQYKIIGHIDIKKEMYKYDYVCLFFIQEGLGNILVEGCMFGKPLITNNIDAVMEVNKHGYNGFVVKDWKELILCINSLPDRNSDGYKRLSYNARKHYEECFTFEKMILSYKKAIENI